MDPQYRLVSAAWAAMNNGRRARTASVGAARWSRIAFSMMEDVTCASRVGEQNSQPMSAHYVPCLDQAASPPSGIAILSRLRW